MPQPHRQRRVKALDRPVEGDRHRLAFRFGRILLIAVELRWENEVAPVIRVLPQRQVVSDQFLHRRVLQQLLLARVRDLRLLRHAKLAGQRDFLRQRTDGVRLLLGHLDHREGRMESTEERFAPVEPLFESRTMRLDFG